MLRSILAVVAGFAGMTVLVMIGSVAIAAAMIPGGLKGMRDRMQRGDVPLPSMRIYATNLVMSLIAAIVGGWITLRLAPSSPDGHLLALAVVVLLMGAVSAFAPGGAQQARWYKLLIPVVGAAGVLASGVLFPA